MPSTLCWQRDLRAVCRSPPPNFMRSPAAGTSDDPGPRRTPLRTLGRVNLDHDGYPVGDDVIDGCPSSRLLDELAQLLGARVALDREAHGDLAVAVAHVGVEAEDAVEVDVACHGGA